MQELADSSDRWDRLAEQASEPNPFFESWYLLLALRIFNEKRVHLLAYEEEGELHGLMPVHFRSRYYGKPIPHLSNWLHMNCFLSVPLVAQGSEVAFWQAMLDWADAHAGPSLLLHLRTFTLGGPIHAALKAAAASQGRRMEAVLSEERAFLDSDKSAQQYWEASLSHKKRKELRRQEKRLGELGKLSIERTTNMTGLDRWLEDFLALEAAGWKGQAGSALSGSPRTAALFRQSLCGAAERGKLERLTLSLDSRPSPCWPAYWRLPAPFPTRPPSTRTMRAIRPESCCSARTWRCWTTTASPGPTAAPRQAIR